MARRIARGNVSAKQACAWVGLDYDTYLKLVHERCLVHTPAGGVDGGYFVGLYVFNRLVERVGFETIRHIWPQVRAEIPWSDESTAEFLKLYVGIPMPTAKIVRSADEVIRLMSDEQGGRLIDLRPHIVRARNFFVDRQAALRKTPGEAGLRVLIQGKS